MMIIRNDRANIYVTCKPEEEEEEEEEEEGEQKQYNITCVKANQFCVEK